MDVTKYFKIVSVSDHVVHLENKGFWSDNVAEQVGNAFLAEFRKAAKEASREGPFIVLADLRQMEVLSREEGRVALSRVMSCARAYGMYRAVEVVPNTITRLSIREAAELTGKPEFRIVVDTMDDALATIETLKREMLATAAGQASTT